jgi:hypothetical protein
MLRWFCDVFLLTSGAGDPVGVALKVARSKTGAPLGTFQHGDAKSIVLQCIKFLLEARI